jgi:hypothetical protein
MHYKNLPLTTVINISHKDYLGNGTATCYLIYLNVLFSQNSIWMYMNWISLQYAATAESFLSIESASPLLQESVWDVTTSSFSNTIPSEDSE